MAGKKLTYTVDVDDSDLRRLGQSFSEAGRDARTAFTGLEGALAKANADVNGLEDNLRGMTAAFNAVKAVSGDAFSDDEIVAYIQTLGRLGAEFDQIVGDADRVADSLKRATDVNMGRTVQGAGEVSDSLARIRDNGDQSRSVLANLAGNAAQDLGELGGVVGSLGVGVGQLAEYAVDGNIKLSQLAAVAGPMAALSGALLLVQSGMKGIADIKAFDAERAEQFTDAIREGASVFDALADSVADTGQLLTAQSGAVGNFGGAVKDILPLLQRYGFSFGEFQALLSDDAALQALIDYRDGLDATQDAVARSDYLKIINGVNDYRTAINSATDRQAELAQFLRMTPEMVTQSADAFQAASDTGEQYANLWALLIDQLQSGGDATQYTAVAMNELMEITGMTADEIWAMAQSKLDEQLQADADAAVAAADSMSEFYDQMKAVNDAGRALNLTLDSADYDAAGIREAADALQQWFNATAAGGTSENVIFQYQDALAAFTENLVANQGIVQGALAGMFTPKGPEAREQLRVLEALGETVMPQITQAYDDANGSFETFNRSVTQISDSIHRDLVAALIESGVEANDAEDQANALQQALGLVPQNVRTMYDLQGDAEAVAKLALLQGVIDGLPEDVQTEVALHVLADDPQAAINTIETYARNHPPTSPLKLDPDTGAVQNELNGTTFSARLRLNAIMNNAILGGIIGATTSAGTIVSASRAVGLAAPAPAADPVVLDAAVTAGPNVAAPYVPALIAPAAEPVTQHFHIALNAGVIGNRFEIDRQVRRSLRRSARINGQRATVS